MYTCHLKRYIIIRLGVSFARRSLWQWSQASKQWSNIFITDTDPRTQLAIRWRQRKRQIILKRNIKNTAVITIWKYHVSKPGKLLPPVSLTSLKFWLWLLLLSLHNARNYYLLHTVAIGFLSTWKRLYSITVTSVHFETLEPRDVTLVIVCSILHIIN